MPSANVVQTSVSGGQQNALALQGDGVFLPKLSTATRTALTLGTSDKGFLAYDTTDNNVYIWNGAAWESIPASGDSSNTQVIFNDNGILAGDAGLTYDKATDALTISGDLTVDTSTLKVDSANNRVGIRTASPSEPLTVDNTAGVTTGAIRISAGDQAHSRLSIQNLNGQAYHLVAGNPGASNAGFALYDNTAGSTRWYVDNTGVQTWSNVGGVAGTAMTLNSTGLGVGQVPSTSKLEVGITNTSTAGLIEANALKIENNNATVNNAAGLFLSQTGNAGCGIAGIATSRTGGSRTSDLVLYYYNQATSASPIEGLRLTASGNVGIGVTPSAWGSGFRYVQAGPGCAYGTNGSVDRTDVAANWYYNGGDKYINATGKASIFQQSGGAFFWLSTNTASGGAGSAMTLNTNMVLDASGNLLVGTTTANGRLTVTQTANSNAAYFTGNVGNFLNFYGWSVDSTWNTSAAAIFVGKNTSTSRSINAGGTVNASGADYAEYMTKAGDFVLAKGDIAGVDANGNLTNVFADAVSFVVKSTNPSYVGNDKWGIDLEGDALEAARQLVDRIAFAGQVPVNVTGAKAGDYIVPVVDGTGIKGIAVSNPTFEQYQLAVGKVIAIDADGRARIIVKVA